MIPLAVGLAWALATAAGSSSPAAAAATLPSATVSEIEDIFRSINEAWSASYGAQAYTAPRLLTLRRPGGHPAHGAGYSAGVVLIDLNDVDAIDRVFGPRGRALKALLIAHEVGHHVQYLRTRSKGGATRDLVTASELQADCYAGWSLETASKSGLSIDSDQTPSSLDRDLPRLLYLLSMARAGRLSAESDPTIHGTPRERLAAIKAGQSSASASGCE